MKALIFLTCGALLTGCDLAGTAAGTAAGASAEVQQAQQAKQTEDRVKQQVEASMQVNKAQLQQADKDSQ